MDINYYVLWKKDNTMLLGYLEKFYVLLENKLVTLSEKWIISHQISQLLSHAQKKEFILDPDISSIILAIYAELIDWVHQHLWDIQKYVQKLSWEIDIFIAWDHEKLAMNRGTKINNTHIRLTYIDNNPYNIMEAHPDHEKTWWNLWWWEKSEEEWIDIYSKTFEILEKTDEGIYDELNMIIKKIVPLGTSYKVHNSCSYKECIGHLYMGYTVDSDAPEINNLEAIIHESSHNKLNLLMHFDPIIINDYQEIYYSPYRPDPRHMHWIYLGLHAFAPTIYILLWAYLRWLINWEYWGEKIVLYHVKNKLALKMIEKYSKLTPLWIEILEEMKYIMSLTEGKIKDMHLSSDIIKRVNDRAREHFSQAIIKSRTLVY